MHISREYRATPLKGFVRSTRLIGVEISIRLGQALGCQCKERNTDWVGKKSFLAKRDADILRRYKSVSVIVTFSSTFGQ